MLITDSHFYKKLLHLIPMIVLVVSVCIPVSSTVIAKSDKPSGYGVYIGQDSIKKIRKKAKNKKTIVIEGQSFSKKKVKSLKKGGRKVYSYLNVGSLEIYRPYYEQYKDLCLKVYENWEDEYWVDVSDTRWQDFIADTLAKKLIQKGVDGLFLDNCDVYYQFHTAEIYNGLRNIIRRLNTYNVDLIVNGGDTFVSKLIKNGEQELITGVNQETVFSRIIDYDKDTLGTQKKSEREYFTKYLSKAKKNGLKVYLLEYTRNDRLKNRIKAFCRKKGYGYYVSGSIKLL